MREVARHLRAEVLLGVLALLGQPAIAAAQPAQPAPTTQPTAQPKPAAQPKPKPDQPPAEEPKPAEPKPKKPPAKKPAAQPAAPGAQPPAPGQPPPPPPPPGAQPPPPGAQPPTGVQPGQPPAAPQPTPETQPKPTGTEPLIAPEPSPPPGPPVTTAPPTPPKTAPDPDRDVKALSQQGGERPTGAGEIGAKPSDVYAEDWWSHARPTFELHGYYRLRAELFHNFALGRKDDPNSVIWPQPSDNDWARPGYQHPVELCGDDAKNPERCENNTQAGANMRFRLNPELHISDNLRVLSQIDLLDNVVLGSTPEGYSNVPAIGQDAEGNPVGSGYRVVGRGGYAPLGAFATTQWAPSAGQNSWTDSIAVKRVWGEYVTPVGVLRFGRMPSHWGLGILANSGDGYDSDWQSTADRIMFITGIKKYDIYFAGAWDFPNEGPISSPNNERQGQQYDLGQYDDVSQYVLVAVRRRNPDLQKLELAKGEVVLNGGMYFVFRNQFLANDTTNAASSANLGQNPADLADGYVRRDAQAYIPDLWFQFNYKKFRFEMESVLVLGSLGTTGSTGGATLDENPIDDEDPGWNIRQFGMATQAEFKAVEDRLRIHFGFGYATGDDDIASLAPQGEGLQPQLTADRTFSTFRFHPDYRIDLILWRNILNRVQGAYYFRPGVDYDFTRDKNGQRLGGGAAVIWSRASEFVQTPGHARDLGIELNFQLYFQSKDGTLNDDPDKMGGFFTSLQYGVLFPLGGLGYLPRQIEQYEQDNITAETETAQTLRWFLGIMF